MVDYLAQAPWLPPLGWVPSPNFNSRGGVKIDQLIVHDMEGYDEPSEELFEERSSHVSAHYTVSSDGQRIDQMVEDAERAWHACDFNSRSIGVEMEGFAKAGYPQAELLATARLFAHLADKYGIPIQYAKGGVGPGIASHWSLGREGGGHSDPEPDDTWITNFVALVKAEHDAGRYPKVYEHGDHGGDTPPLPIHDITTTAGVQQALRVLHFSIQVDGQLGPETEAVVASFNIIAGVPTPIKGQITDLTRAALTKALSGG